jgi:hypothetical protein
MAVPNIFANATTSIPLSQLDQNFATAITLGNTAVYLGNTTTTLGNVTLTNVNVASGNVTISALTTPNINSGSGSALTIQSNSVTGIYMDTSQNVGFGTTSPNAKASIVTSSNSTSVLGTYSNNTNNNYAIIATQDSAGNFATFFGTQTTNQASSLSDFVVGTNAGSGAAERVRVDSSGNIGQNTTTPATYDTSGKMFTQTGTANNSGPSAHMMQGSSQNPGAGYYCKEVFAIAGIGFSATEITRITGTGSNGIGMYVRVTVNGHTSTISSAINYKGVLYQGGTSAVTQVETATSGTIPTLTFDTSTNNVLVIKLTSAGSGQNFNGVMVVEWYVPIDFNSNTWTIS